MAIWNKPNPNNGQPNDKPRATPDLVRSRFHEILDDMDEAYARLDHAAHVFSTLIVDVEKGMKFIDKFRVDLTQAIGTNGTVEHMENNIAEAVVKEYAPKAIREAPQT